MKRNIKAGDSQYGGTYTAPLIMLSDIHARNYILSGSGEDWEEREDD